ncbi:MAG TPA: sigma-54 dependent transcriptional regulator [Verrucomicrobiae bacterium]|nr:sigma-54 dependent transcriptional regulator [Verrucomicrobiae bacterium]
MSTVQVRRLSQNRILVVDIDPVIRSGICSFLSAQGHIVCDVSNYDDAQTELRRFRPEALVLDLYLPNGDVPQLLRLVKALQPAVPVVVLSGQSSADAAGRAVRMGADQILVKPVELHELHAVLLRLLKGERISSRSTLSHKSECIDPFVGTSAAIQNLRTIASRVLSSESPILLQGETGSGKGVLANWIHRNGPRAHKPFLDLNCAGLSRELLESELFGYEKGAFTSAVNAKQGLLEVANRGTVFLDEIGDIDLQVQPKLLKVLEERTFRRLGDVRDRAVDIRLISATHRELPQLVREKQFRSDLFFRLNIFFVSVPSLRERKEDIALLSQRILTTITRRYARPELRISDSAMGDLERYPWPGNIRELRNVMERAAMVADHGVISPEHLHFQVAGHEQLPSGLNGTLKDVECAYIRHVLQDEGGSIEHAARRLGIPRSSLYNKMRRFDIPHGTGRLLLD